jgi:bisanhydrobacterioruberin hydratase
MSMLRGMLSKVSSDGPRQFALCLLLPVYIVLWIGGVAHHFLIGNTPPGQNWIASLFLLLAALVLLVKTASFSDLLRLAGVALAGLFVEALGVRSGLPFGAYLYTDVLQPQLFDVPLVMACAWMVLIAYLKQTARYLSWRAWMKALLMALWMTAIDLVIDPLAANQLGYWRWLSAGAYYGIPLSNFAGWFVVSLLIFIIWRREWRENYWASMMGLSILLFFTLIALAHQLFLAGSIGLMLCALHVLVRRFPLRAAAL